MIFLNWGLNGIVRDGEHFRTILYIGFNCGRGSYKKVRAWFKYDGRCYNNYSYYSEHGGYCGYSGSDGDAGWVGLPKNFVIDIIGARNV